MTSEELKTRTKAFAHRCVKLAMAMPNTKLGHHIQGQLIRCSTSVAANYRAASLAQSKAGFKNRGKNYEELEHRAGELARKIYKVKQAKKTLRRQNNYLTALHETSLGLIDHFYFIDTISMTK